MVNGIQRFKFLTACTVLCTALTACGPRLVPVESLSGYSQSGSYGDAYTQDHYSQAGYSQGAYSQGPYTQSYASQKSRYGHQASAGLRAPCEEAYAPCGFMRVLPIYPVYQYVIPTEPEPVVEVPTISLPDPEPVVIYEAYEPEPIPEPVYAPAPYHWPEPETEVPSWKPLRK